MRIRHERRVPISHRRRVVRIAPFYRRVKGVVGEVRNEWNHPVLSPLNLLVALLLRLLQGRRGAYYAGSMSTPGNGHDLSLCSGFAHLMHATSPTGYIAWWSVDYISICCAILASALVSGRFAFYCSWPLQLLFFTSTAGLLFSSLVAVLAIASPALRATSFLLFVLFSNGVPFLLKCNAPSRKCRMRGRGGRSPVEKYKYD